MTRQKMKAVIGFGTCAQAVFLLTAFAFVGGCENNCIQSQESPSTEGNCEEGFAGQVCVQEIENVAQTSTYIRGVHFLASSLNIDLTWCPDADCSDATNGRAIHVVVIPQGDGDPILFVANCQNRRVVETVDNVQEIVIQEAPNLSEENTACGGNEVSHAFAKWEICEVPILRN